MKAHMIITAEFMISLDWVTMISVLRCILNGNWSHLNEMFLGNVKRDHLPAIKQIHLYILEP